MEIPVWSLQERMCQMKLGILAILEALSFLTTGQKIGLIGPAIRGVAARDQIASELALSPPEYFPQID